VKLFINDGGSVLVPYPEEFLNDLWVEFSTSVDAKGLPQRNLPEAVANKMRYVSFAMFEAMNEWNKPIWQLIQELPKTLRRKMIEVFRAELGTDAQACIGNPALDDSRRKAAWMEVHALLTEDAMKREKEV
jgi:hypothetical protein